MQIMRRRAIRAGRVSINPDWNADLLNIWKTAGSVSERPPKRRVIRKWVKNNYQLVY